MSQQRKGLSDTTASQPDLFDAGAWSAAPDVAPPIPPGPKEYDDAALIEALPYAGLAVCQMLCAEVVARRLIEAVPSLEALCRRFKGFGRHHPVREQIFAIETLAALGGKLASAALIRLVSGGIIEAPGLPTAFAAAIVLRARLPAEIVLAALEDEEPRMRALACRCAAFWPQAAPRLVELLDDLHASVADAAAVTLGEMARPEAIPRLMRLVQTAPSVEAIDALVSIADERGFVLLGKVAETQPDLRPLICEALSEADHPRAVTVLQRLRQT